MNSKPKSKLSKFFATLLLVMLKPGISLYAQTTSPSLQESSVTSIGLWMFLILMIVAVLAVLIWLKNSVAEINQTTRDLKKPIEEEKLNQYMKNFDSTQIDTFLKFKDAQKKSVKGSSTKMPIILLIATLLLPATSLFAQTTSSAPPKSLLGEGGIIITIILILIPLLLGLILMAVKTTNVLRQFKNKRKLEEAQKIAEKLQTTTDETFRESLEKRKAALDFQLSRNELSGLAAAEDEKGLLNINTNAEIAVVNPKKKATKRPNVDPALSKMILWYIGCAAFWLVLGTSVGEYLGIKFVAPDVDHVSWLSFGRLRPVHTNMVFWGWASLAMLGLGYYIVPRVGNNKLASMKLGWWTLILINLTVIFGSISLMAGINNGGGEYREYIWPIMLPFAVGLVLTLINFLKTIAKRKTTEIYIANWYIVAAIIFTIVIALVAYLPWWQDGLGETIAQGYYMHQGVGMWFMLYTLGVVYYFLPQQLNKPIYSYSLGILAFWTQILFYTLIGSHHFVFSPIPWWLQTVAIVGSMGMVIPVIAGTTNFLMTFKSGWHKIAGSYTLPFFLVGIICYFTGSLQGTAEAFRSTNLMWHFTDFTVAHSHLTMYGIICFFMWAGIYALVPRLTGKEPPQILVGAHFWLALIGMLFYTVPLMLGGTLKGLMWMQGKPFIDGVVLMGPYWLWRAIGGSLMWLSHIFFAYNLYKMLSKSKTVDVKETAIAKLVEN
ncbi:cbb3-type cytochrome c oxidase subunit I [Arachidicoccus sp.]|uniref:cbb3-type cytochrome c oxidase subunit I n=1 Tax=Arachidicoccus sp. TaxID=1872624 RepID=UPI003D1E7345